MKKNDNLKTMKWQKKNEIDSKKNPKKYIIILHSHVDIPLFSN